jgi:brefeldin A-resistance guanine nucleotide exchange factor 1
MGSGEPDSGKPILVARTSSSSEVISIATDQKGASEYVQRAWGADVLLDNGIPAILARIMSLCSGLMQIDDNPKDTVVQALKLVNIALEAGGTALSKLDPVVAFLKGEMCRNLLKTSHSSDLEILSLSLRVVFNLFSSIKDHMKIQLEVFLASVHLRLLHSSTAPAEQKELVLESLLEFCQEPAMVHDLYINYDCDVRCTNLFDAIMTELCRQAIPSMFGSGRAPSTPSVKDSQASKNEEWLPHHLQGSWKTITNRRKLSREGRRSRSASDVSDVSEPVEGGQSAYLSLVTVNILNRLALESLLAVQHSIARRCLTGPAPRQVHVEHVKPKPFSSTTAMGIDDTVLDEEEPWDRGQQPLLNTGLANNVHEALEDSDFLALARARTAEVLRQRRIKKQRMALAAEKFNAAPCKTAWVSYAQELGLIAGTPDAPADPKAVANFLRNTPALEKSGIGEFLSKGPPEKYPFNAAVLKEYVATFDFTSMRFDEALRTFLSNFRLPGEAQCIDRFMEAFAKRLIEQCGTGQPFADSDAAFILAFSTIMLNTDLHNKQIPDSRRMKLEEFIRNNRGINAGKDLPKEFLEDLYNRIKSNQLQVRAITPVRLYCSYTGAAGAQRHK